MYFTGREENYCMPIHLFQDDINQLRLDPRGQRTAFFPVHPENLMWASIGCARQKALLASRRPASIDEDPGLINALVFKQFAQYASCAIVPGYTGQTHFCLQSAKQRSDAGRATETNFFSLGAEDHHRSFRADAIRLGPGIAVQHQVSENEYTRGSKAIEFRQHTVHGLTSHSLLWRRIDSNPPCNFRYARSKKLDASFAE
jgi:hypothetical protein